MTQTASLLCARVLKSAPALLLAFFLATLALLPQSSHAQSSRIQVIVDDTAITSMDIANRARLLQLANKLGAAAAQKAAVEELIDDTLRANEVKRRGINIPESAVDNAIAEIAARSKLTPAQFAKALGSAGVNIKTLKERIRVQMAWGRIVRARMQQTMKQEQNDLIAQMRKQEKPAGEVTAEDYILQRIVFTLPAKASSADVARRRKEAEGLRARFKGCESGIALAKGIREVAVLNVGRRLASEIPPNMREMVKSTPEGGLTKPEIGDQGIEMFAVCKKITVTGESAAMVAGLDAEEMSGQAKTISDTITRELRQKANIIYR